MDYKYIEQLLERYWQCETTLEEEQILKTFFHQKELPACLEKYREVFDGTTAQNDTLGSSFDERVTAAITATHKVKARRRGITTMLMPLLKAAAAVAVVVTIGKIAQLSVTEGDETSTIQAEYTDTFNDPAVAYDNVEDALELLSEGISMVTPDDTAAGGNDTTTEQ